MTEIKIDKAELQTALEIVKPGLASKEKLEQSTSFAFIAGRVVTYNDEISVSHPVPGLDLEGAILAENLYKFLGKVKEKEITCTSTSSEIVLTAGKAKAGLILQSEVTLPLKEELGEAKSWKRLPTDFVKDIKFVMAASSKDSSRPKLTCVHVNQSGYVEASDGLRIAWHELTDKMPIPTFLIPATSVIEVVKLNPNGIAVGKGWVHFRTKEKTIISCRILAEEFVQTAPLLRLQGTEVFLPAGLDEVLDRATVFSKRDHLLDEEVLITIKNKKLIMEAKSESAWFKEEVDINFNSEPLTFSITPYLLKGILSETSACELSDKKIKFKGPKWIYVGLLRYLNIK